MAQLANSKKKRLAIIDELAALPLSSSKLMKPSDSLIELWPEQESAVSFVLDTMAAALFFEQRTGKTYITMAVIERLERSTFAGVLVCLLNNRDSTWLDGLAKYLPWLNVTIDWEVYKKLPCPKLFVVHFDALPKVSKKIKNAAKKWINFCAIDEAHRLKNRGSGFSRAAARLCEITRRLILTGTPIEKNPKDLWAQFRFLIPTLFGPWKEFEDKFLDVPKIDMTGVKPGTARWQIKVMQQGMLRSRAPFREEKLPTLIRMIKPYARRLTKVDVGILPPKIIQKMVDIDGSQRRLYQKMKKTSVIHLPGGERSMAPMVVTNIMKRRQIASGFVFDDDGECHTLKSAKLDRLIALFSRLPKPVVVFTAFRPDNDRITSELRALGYDIAQMHGGVNKRDRPGILRSFQRAQYDGIVCQMKTGGVGVDLWKGSYGIVHSMTHSSIDFNQAMSRMDSKLKTTAAKIYVLCGRATIDEDLYDMVVQKGMDANAVLKELKKGAR